MIEIHIDAYRTRWSKKEKRLFLPFEIDSDKPVRAIEVSMEGDGAGPYLRATFAEPRDGRNCRGLGFKPERVGMWYPLVKAFYGLEDREPAAVRRGPSKVTVTEEAVFLPPDPAGPAPFHIRAAFYYPWFVGPDGWGPGTIYTPTLGRYDLADPLIIDQHVKALEYGKFQAAISSWWGQGTRTDLMLPRLLERSEGHDLSWCIYHEFEGHTNPSTAQIRSDLTYVRDRYASHPNYLKIGGRFVVFVYSADDGADCTVASRWKEANNVGAYVVLKSVINYPECPDQPDGWHQYGPANAVQTTWDNAGRLHSYNISPGFWHVEEGHYRLARDPARWKQNVRDMVASGARWQLTTSYNEHGEGTGVESCEEWASASGYGAYLDVLHDVV